MTIGKPPRTIAQSRAEQSRAEQSRAEQSRAASTALQENCHSQESVMESSEFQSRSVIHGIHKNSESLNVTNQRLDSTHSSNETDLGNISRDKSLSTDTNARKHIIGFSYRKCNGIIGVPISYIDKHNYEQFSILGITLGNTIDYPMTNIYINAIQHNKDGSVQGGSKVNTRAAILIEKKPNNTIFYTADNINGYLLSIYPRILLQRRHI